MAWATRSPSCTHSRVAACVAASTTGGATPASKASCQRGAHRHHWSPGCSPSNPNSGCGRRQVVADRRRERQELRGDPGADRVHADVLGAGVAAAVTVEAGERVVVAGLELFAENVLCHGPFHHGGAELGPPPGGGSGSPALGAGERGSLVAVDPGERFDRVPASTGGGPTPGGRAPPGRRRRRCRGCRRARARRPRGAPASVVITPPRPSVRAASSRLQTKG